jgi:leucyl/phenylalanyl-tRNA--protein transferase
VTGYYWHIKTVSFRGFQTMSLFYGGLRTLAWCSILPVSGFPGAWEKKLKKKIFTLTVNQAFEQTIQACSQPRKDPDEGTWLVKEMQEAYIELHHKGYAHSVEAWHQDRLVGGLYGVGIGCMFFGESMFSFQSDASKAALVALAHHLETHGFDLIDCQVTTDHLCRMGAVEIPRYRFLDILGRSIIRQPVPGVWDCTTIPSF